MQLVVMAAVLALAGAGQENCNCHPIDYAITLESCGRKESIHTTICEGWCYLEDPSYVGDDDSPRQKICNGDWTYEVKHIKGCPVAVTYPVARSCNCTTCDIGNTDCGHFHDVMPRCT